MLSFGGKGRVGGGLYEEWGVGRWCCGKGQTIASLTQAGRYRSVIMSSEKKTTKDLKYKDNKNKV